MKKLIIVYIYLFVINIIVGQNQNPQAQYQLCTGCSVTPSSDGTPVTPNQNFPYGNSTPYAPEDVASDFGPRWLNSTSNPVYRYDWHKGVDFKFSANWSLF